MKTKATLLYLLTLLLTVFSVQPVQAQAVQDALYIFRNDGKFDAFFYGDIKRIEYSKIDTLGVEQPDYVVQEIYALDTLYRIPISAIDSVAFVTPETKIKADVFCPDKSIADYITASDSVVWIRLAKNTPASLIPKVGDKLFIEESSKYLPNGFVGLVTKVDNGSNGYTITTGDLELVDIFDRLVAKAAASTMPAKSRTRMIDGTEMNYTRETPIDIINEKGDFSLSGSYTMGKYGPLEITGDLSGKLKYQLKSQMEIRAILFFDVLSKPMIYQYDQKIRTINNFDLELEAAGSLSGGIDLPIKKFSAALSKFFNANIEAGLTMGGQFTALKLGLKGHAKGEIHQFLVQKDDNWNPLSTIGPEPNILTSTKNTNYGIEFDTNIDGGWSFNAGAYAQVNIGVCYPFKKNKGAVKPEDLGPGVDMKMRVDIGAKLELDAPVLGIYPEKILSPLTTIDSYNKLNEHGSISTAGYVKGALSGELGKWKISAEDGQRNVEFLKKELYIVPNFTDFKVEQDQEEPIRPYRIRMSSTADRDIFLGTKIGFEVYDDDDKLVADSLCNFYFREDGYKKDISDGTNGCVFELDPDKENVRTLHAYPMVLYKNNHLLAKDLRYDFTLDPARIDIAKREISTGSDPASMEIEVIPNMANVEVKAEADWLNKISPAWLPHKNQLTVYWPELPADVKDRRGVVRLIGKSKKGETLVEDSIVVHQFVPYVELTPDELEFDAKGGTQTVTIGKTNLTNLKVRANSDDIKLKFEGNTITVTMDENKTSGVRGGQINVEGTDPNGQTGNYGVIFVTQKAASGGGQQGGEGEGSGSFGIKELSQSAYANFICENPNECEDIDQDTELMVSGGILVDGSSGRKATATVIDENTIHIDCSQLEEFPDEEEPELKYRYDRTFSADIHRVFDADGNRHLIAKNVHYNHVITQTYQQNQYEAHFEFVIENINNFHVYASPGYDEDTEDGNGNPIHFHLDSELYINGDREHWGLEFSELNYTEEFRLNNGKDVYKYKFKRNPKPKDSFNLHIVFNDDSTWGQWIGEDGIYDPFGYQQSRTRTTVDKPKDKMPKIVLPKPVRKLPIR